MRVVEPIWLVQIRESFLVGFVPSWLEQENFLFYSLLTLSFLRFFRTDLMLFRGFLCLFFIFPIVLGNIPYSHACALHRAIKITLRKTPKFSDSDLNLIQNAPFPKAKKHLDKLMEKTFRDDLKTDPRLSQRFHLLTKKFYDRVAREYPDQFEIIVLDPEVQIYGLRRKFEKNSKDPRSELSKELDQKYDHDLVGSYFHFLKSNSDQLGKVAGGHLQNPEINNGRGVLLLPMDFFLTPKPQDSTFDMESSNSNLVIKHELTHLEEIPSDIFMAAILEPAIKSNGTPTLPLTSISGYDRFRTDSEKKAQVKDLITGSQFLDLKLKDGMEIDELYRVFDHLGGSHLILRDALKSDQFILDQLMLRLPKIKPGLFNKRLLNHGGKAKILWESGDLKISITQDLRYETAVVEIENFKIAKDFQSEEKVNMHFRFHIKDLYGKPLNEISLREVIKGVRKRVERGVSDAIDYEAVLDRNGIAPREFFLWTMAKVKPMHGFGFSRHLPTEELERVQLISQAYSGIYASYLREMGFGGNNGKLNLDIETLRSFDSSLLVFQNPEGLQVKTILKGETFRVIEFYSPEQDLRLKVKQEKPLNGSPGRWIVLPSN
jgi:hypothetical protein